MRWIEAVVGVIGLAFIVWRIARLFNDRKRLLTLVVSDGATSDYRGIVTPDLMALGLGDAVRHGRFLGARGVIDGRIVTALSVNEGAPGMPQRAWTVGIAGLDLGAFSARAQKTRRAADAVPLGIEDIDSRVDVTGDPEAARALFSGPVSARVVDLITVYGWQILDGQLVRRIATESMMPVVIKAGLDVARLVRPSAPRP
ncbi:MAG: hypothetical protein JNJ59_19735 [Deltaproteobacteria bacterium]|nr:hypothetical protein [Deltaproteobacteria bacterium]